MKRFEGTFRGFGGRDLYGQGWEPEGECRAVLAIVHGVGEHSGRYMNVVNRVVPCGFAAYGFDQRGHGRSPGRRGHINKWADYREDLRAFLQWTRERQSGRALFLYGHSMGALVVLDYALRHPEGLRGTIVSGAPLEPAGVAKPHLVFMARLLSRIWPTFPLALRLERAALSRDDAVVAAYAADPLVHDRTTARWGAESLATVAWVNAHARDLRMPVLILHGEADRINSAAGSRRFFDAVTFPDKTLQIYPGTYHEPHNDIGHDRVLDDVEEWMMERVQ
jgi:alpha-beta hydrolase superfamily lysophospholipase